MSPIHLFPLLAMHLSPILAGSVRLSGCLQFIWFPVLLVVYGFPDISNSFVSPYINPFVSQSGWWRPAMSPIHLFPLIAIHLSPNLAGGVRLSGCLHFICFPLQQVWLVVSALCMSPIHLFPLIAIHLSPILAGSVRLSGCLRLIVSPYSKSFVSQSGWRCPALRMSPLHLSPLIAIYLSPSLSPIDLFPL